MINYNPKEWFTFIFRFHRNDTFRQLLPLMLALSVYTALIAYVELNFLNLAEWKELSNVGLMHSVLGFVISLLLVFRTNTAYDRWWEGRKQWGSLTNSCRNLAIKARASLAQEEWGYFQKMIPNYAFAVKNLLRESENYSELEPVLDLKPTQHVPNQIAAAIYERVMSIHRRNGLTSAQLFILSEEIKAFTDICGACERIKNTPIPFTYSVFFKKFIFFYVMTLPFGWVFSMGYFAVPVVALILYVLASLELIAEEIENPFGTDANDLPIDQICSNIKKHVGEILS
ncbi:MAG TPA: bestrophin family ion channel [Myxococcaceae bacterium]|jgi:putative membrane protein